MNKNFNIAVMHLGCEKNRVDTEHMLGLLTAAKYNIVSTAEAAHLVIVNTCSFIAAAREEAIHLLMELEAQKKQLIITGCLAQHFKNELLREIPAAAAVVGTADYQNIVKVVERTRQGETVSEISQVPTFIADSSTPRIRTSNKAIAWMRIAEGCDCRCAFCIIPKLRGKHRSRSIKSITKEAQDFATQGVQELILISQNTTYYGTDISGKSMLPELINSLRNINIPWIRLHYAYPTGITNELLEAMKNNPRILPYFDIPLQHSHPDILKAMRRPYSEKYTLGIIAKIREYFPQAVLRTTFIVGFPGETNAHFKHLLNFIKQIQFDHVGVFCYSAEEGTPAFAMPKQVGKRIMEKRRDEIMVAQQAISAQKNRACVDTTVDVLIEKQDGDSFIGRSARFSPEVDGMVIVKGKAKVGTIMPVKITCATIYDLDGDVV